MLSVSPAILVTGGSGFIGSNFIHHLIETTDARVVNLDKLTYAGNPANLESISHNPRYVFVHGDVSDTKLVEALLVKYKPDEIAHFAAESHVDRSISGPDAFLQTNIIGTYSLLQSALPYYRSLDPASRTRFRFLHVSTDEVYGTLSPTEPAFHEGTPYAPNSPYAASKASSDHLVRAWFHTYGLPTIITNCSNNYGRYQFPEKLIPLVTLNALAGKSLPIYGDGRQVRDWLFVEDHCRALMMVLRGGRVGETYNIGGGNQQSNLEVVRTICTLLNELSPNSPVFPHEKLIRFVEDRPGHDRRYAINAHKIEAELSWRALESFETGLRKTVSWYLANSAWAENVTTGAYQQWIGQNYGSRTFAESGTIQ